jgi:DNA-binding XRE family transcriptional regulator
MPGSPPDLTAAFGARLREDLAHLEAQAPGTRSEDLAEIRSALDQTATELAAEVRTWVELLAPDRPRDVLRSPRLAAEWRLPWAATSLEAPVRKVNGRLITGTVVVSDLSNGDAPRSWRTWARLTLARPAGTTWPARAPSSEVASWISERLRKACPQRAVEFDAERAQDPAGRGAALDLPHVGRIPPAASFLAPFNAALIFDVHREAIEEGRERAAFPIDTGNVHREFLATMASMPKHPGHKTSYPLKGRTLRLYSPGSNDAPIQLSLELDEPSINAALMRAIRELRSFEGLRAYGTLLTLAGHDARATWTLGAHLDAMQLPKRQRTPAKRKAIADLVWTILRLELQGEALDRQGRFLPSEALFELGTSRVRSRDTDLGLEAIEYRLNPRIFDGVRTSDGAIGSNWWPVPRSLLALDGKAHGPAIALGMQLPAHFRMRTNDAKDQEPVLVRSAERLITLGGMPMPRPRMKGGEPAGWLRFERMLDTLIEAGSLGEWRWREGARTARGMLELAPAPWAVDRVVRGIRPRMLLGGAIAPTGAEVRRWREATGRSQADLAAELSVDRKTVNRLERAEGERVRPAIAARLRELGLVDNP